jgi:uncharacterized protein GlcG (DUF336 family)
MVMGVFRKLVHQLSGKRAGVPSARPMVEELERRLAPALIASQLPLTPPTLTTGQVDQLLQRAAAATSSDDAIVAVVDRNGNILGVRVEGGVSSAITSDPTTLGFAIDGAIAEARTGAYFSSDAAPLTSRTVQFISQSTILQREVDSSPDNPDPTLSGPGLVAPIGIGGHYPPGVAGTPLVDLFEIELTNRDGMVKLGPGGELVPYGINPAYIPAGNLLNASGVAYGQAIMTPGEQANKVIPKPQSRGIGTLPGGIPIYEYGELVGGIGVFFPGTTGYASEENSSLSVNFDPSKPDLSLEAEFIALAAVGGSSGAGFPVGTLGGVPALPGFDLPFKRIDLAGITLPTVGPGGDQGPSNLVSYAQAHYAIGQGNPSSGTNEPVDSSGDLFLNGKAVPDGWLVLPHAGTNLSAAQVQQIIDQGIATAELTRSQLRLPIGDTARMVFAVTDSTGAILGLYRMPDAPVFSIDVAIAKARNTAYYDDPAQLQAVDQVPGLPPGVALTNRTFRFLADPFYPEGVDGSTPAPFSILNAPGIDPQNGLNTGAPLPASAYDDTVLGYAAFHANTNFHAMTMPRYQNGVVFFPGSSPIYTTIDGSQQIVGGFGVSGDGVNQDDFITVGGIAGFAAPSSLAADQYFVRDVRLPYFNFPPNPEN